MKTKRPFFSIITFVKNGQETIANCIESILNQDCKDIEYIIQDGKSTDNTLNIISRYQSKDKRIFLESSKDNFSYEAWYKGLSRCRGRWIGFLMADETYCKNCLSKVKKEYDEGKFDENYGFVYGDGFVVDYFYNYLGKANTNKEFVFEDYLLNLNLPHPGNSFLNKDLLIEAGLHDGKWNWDCCEYEVFLRLGRKYPARFLPINISNFSFYEGQQGGNKENLERACRAEIKLFKEFFSKKENISLKHLEKRAIVGILLRTAEINLGNNNLKDSKKYVLEALKNSDNPHEVIKFIKRTSDSRRKPQCIGKKEFKFQKMVLAGILPFVYTSNSFFVKLTLNLLRNIKI